MRLTLPRLLLSSCLLLAVIVAALPAGAAPVVLFSDDFDPDPFAGWTASPLGLFSGWDASGGSAAYDGGGHTQLYAGDPAWDDYTVTAEIELANGMNFPGGVRGRVDVATGAGYAAWLYPAEGVIRLYRTTAWDIDSSGLVTLAQSTVGTIAPSVTHTLALAFDGDDIRVTFDGVQAIQLLDPVLTAGVVALDVSDQPVEFDDVRVTSPTSSLLLAADFGSDPLAAWTASPLGLFSGWDAASGAAEYDGGGHTQIYAGSSAWDDYTVATTVRYAAAANFPGGIRGRVDVATGAGYAAWVYPGSGVVRLFRAAAWDIDTTGLVQLGEASVGAIAAEVDYTLALRMEGDQVAVEWNGVPAIAVADTAYTTGVIALDVSNQPVSYDDVVVTADDGAPPPLDPGPGGPVLVISSGANLISRYLAEILLAEGVNAYAAVDVADVTPTLLAGYDVAILGETALTSGQVTVLADWVGGGGRLIAMRPDPALATLLGIESASGTLADAYLLVDTLAAPGAGIVDETVQFHGTADLYTLDGADAIATLYSDATTATSYPAVTWNEVGSGGVAVAFTYDLARSVVTTRQGNPAWAGQERDGTPPIRPNDLFFGDASGDPQPDWIDLDKVAIPQADEQQRLLVNLIVELTADRKPLPRFWYLPRGEKAAVVMTGDDHGNNGTEGRFDGYDAASPSACSVEDWECLRGTSYVYPSTPLDPSDAVAYDAAGFEVALHLNTGCNDWTPASLAADLTSQLASWSTAFPGLPAPVTLRTHCIVWSDYASEPAVELAHGIRLDANYYYWPGDWILDRPGFFTGSGLPMRFAATDGTLIDVYQSATQLTDESGQTLADHIDALLDNALGTPGYYAVINANMHTDSSTSAGSDAILASAATHGVPVITARQLLEWLDGRNASTFADHAWSSGTLTFTVDADPAARGLEALLPTTTAAGTLQTLTRDTVAVSYTTEVVKGVEYARFAAASGEYEAEYAP